MQNSNHKQLEYLHIGKTAGTSFRVILEKSPKLSEKIHYNSHLVTLSDIPEGTPILFAVRSPLRRFVSGFYHRKKKLQRHEREGQIHTWNQKEVIALNTYDTINHLCACIFSKNPRVSLKARWHMGNIMHIGIQGTYWYWFHNNQILSARIKDIYSVIRQGTL